ncbi:hypothetical protein DPMN_056441 [Dreissena polymorpha]|uniref:Uncharacterized protein n=1 Tax=Dreissena polymorpha TaxID=45954 RepID=A0A9D4HV22_DREPO|nr:hypothetical protein DPMN_056441 [Dreissena polymorpha]
MVVYPLPESVDLRSHGHRQFPAFRLSLPNVASCELVRRKRSKARKNTDGGDHKKSLRSAGYLSRTVCPAISRPVPRSAEFKLKSQQVMLGNGNGPAELVGGFVYFTIS